MDSKTISLIAIVALAATSFMAINHEQHAQDFKDWQAKYGKVYATEVEEATRFAIYTQNKKSIQEHNSKNSGHREEVNMFADLTKEEFKNIYLGYKPQKKSQKTQVVEESEFVGDVNWVTAGKVQKVKNQGQCGSCWAFSTVAASESLKAINKGVLGDFSEQQLVDCSGSYGNNGCSGGLMDYGFEYFRDKGICTESSYPYTAKDDSCSVSSCTKDSFTISGYTDVSQGSTSGLKAACDKQPVSIAVDANNWSWYGGGVFSNCGSSLDHGVLLAGYTSSYWLVKNSWGPTWGESGYIRLASGNTCGLANSASVPK